MLTADEGARLLTLIDNVKAEIDNGGPISLIDLRIAIENLISGVDSSIQEEQHGCRGGCGGIATDDGYCKDCD